MRRGYTPATVATPRVRAAVFEPAAKERRGLVAALKKAGLMVSAAQAPEALEKEQLVLLGPGLKKAGAVAAQVRSAREDVVVLSAQRALKAPRYADGVVPLPVSPRDLQARLPELLRRAVAPSPKGLAQASSLIDPVTGFYVFQPFKDLLFVELKRSRRYGLALSVALIGVDPPAWTRSPRARERLMAGLALAVRLSLRDTDYAVQYSPDRILLVMPHTELAGAVVVGERIRARVASSTLALGEEVLHPTVSLGLAAPEAGKEISFAELSRRAASCVVEAMSSGGNRIEFYDPAAPPDTKLPE